ncbi:response regulator transcription factor [Phyllobacterium zundukense]|uniref:Cell cycle response regulator CtrA n=1 Tax=Phyllobacterium zundukense TaxID=1867719 RepID=A0A2N9VV93_9HYPH|nr:response regulator transcription factor [Phyllobacterium zundukense]ATU94041.1 DNA-binding response regulator [Phyllobacterium zundukense]PIO43411.1 DNA-binding response regulator [Phyllobacterium zundukense]
MARILLVEDDDRIVGFVKRGLEAEGYLVDLANNGEDALAMVRETPYALIILDRLLPGIDGLEVCRILQRERHENLVLMLTAKSSLQDKVDGLKGGADDYLTKPFAFDELIARIEALLRRGPGAMSDPVLKVGDLTLDPIAKKVRRGEREIGLTAKEFRLLAYLMSHPDAVISRTRLLNNVWDLSFDPETKVVDVYIRYLRRKIDCEGEPPLIKTVRGFGYVISA